MFFYKTATAQEMRSSDWRSDVCSPDLILVEQRGAIEPPPLVGREPAHERKAVRMHPRRSEAQNHVTRREFVGGQHLIALDRTDADSRKIIIAVRIHARHLGGLAADQCAAGLSSDKRRYGTGW